MVFMWILSAVLIFTVILILLIKYLETEIEIFLEKKGSYIQFLFKLTICNYLLFKHSNTSVMKKNFLLELSLRPAYSFKVTQLIMGSLTDYSKEIKELIKITKIKKLVWVTDIGATDPNITGFFVGALWYLKYLIHRKLITSIGFNNFQPQFNIIPYFGRQILDLKFHCIFSLGVGHIIIAASRISWHAFCKLMRR